MYSMQYLGGRLVQYIGNFRDFYYEINPATLTGAIDVVVVEQPDGSFTCSPFHVRFGKLGVLRSRLKVVDLELNGEPLNIHMKLGESGEAFFVEEVPEDEMEASAHLATSPIPESGFLYSQNQEVAAIPRRNSADALDKYQNQVSDFSQRRHTDGQGTQKPDLSMQKKEYQIIKDSQYNYAPSSDAMFTMDGLDDPMEDLQIGDGDSNTLTPSVAAKMFKAEELSDKDSHAKEAIRKISINNDFKPISLVSEANLSPTEESKLNSGDNKENSLEDNSKCSSNGSKKKKKTKKSGSKKKNQRKSSNSSSNGYSSQSEATVPDLDETDNKPDNERLSASQMENEDVSPSQGYNNVNIIQDMHFFSDTDIATENKRQDGTPIQSDSELELLRGSGAIEQSNVARTSQSWRWGELPSPPPQPGGIVLGDSQNQTQTDGTTKGECENTTSLPTQGMLSGVLKFIKERRNTSNQISGEGEGRYLDDLAAGSVDPEIAALYFPQHSHGNVASQTDTLNMNSEMPNEDDYESGNGPSLPQSPSSVEGQMGKGIDSDEDDLKIFCKGYVGLSLCGLSSLQQPLNTLTEAFSQEAIDYDVLCKDPSILQNPKLVVRIGDQYMPWTTAAPILISLLVFHRSLPKNVIQKSLPATVDGKLEAKSDQSGSGNSDGKTWWWSSWRKSNDKQNNECVKVEGMQDAGGILDNELSTTSIQEKLTIIDQETEKTEVLDAVPKKECESPQEVSTQTSFPLLSGAAGGYSGSQSSEDSDEGVTMTSNMGTSQGGQSKSSTDRFRKTLRLSSDQIRELNLKEGMNEMMFSVTTAYQGTSKCRCHIFRWRHDDKIVISDIDGTITKSDVLGHIFPMVGKDWAQCGVAQLFTKIKNNGYKLLYLSARAIGQARVTRDYLRSIKQGDLSLPDGPLLLNPTSLLRAFHREVIEKKPEEFKIQCLSDIQALFPEGSKPFYAGYGNRTNDVCAYQTVGIPIERIFTINHKGELKHELTQTFQSSYSNMSYIVDHLFPPVRGVCEDFSQFNYWREPVDILSELSPPPPVTGLPSIPEGATD